MTSHEGEQGMQDIDAAIESAGLTDSVPATEGKTWEPDSNWSKEEQETFRELGKIPGGGRYQERWHGMWGNMQKYQTQRDQEFAKTRKEYDGLRSQYEPINQTIQPYLNTWQRNGMTPQQGIGRLIAWAEMAGKDPKDFILQFAKDSGLDLKSLTEEQPWVDPAIQGRFSELDERTRRAERSLAEREQRDRDMSMNQAFGQLKAFESEVDEKGQPKHRYFQQVANEMTPFITSGIAKDLPDAYNRACWQNPEIRKLLQEDDAKAQAVARDEAAKKATAANRNVIGSSGNRSHSGMMDLKEALSKAEHMLPG